jgi:hypothetical protein
LPTSKEAGKTATATGEVSLPVDDQFVDITYNTVGFSTGGGHIECGADPGPEPLAPFTIKMNPFTSDVQDVAFAVAGVCDLAVQVEVEYSTTVDFAEGSGTNVVGGDGTEDNFPTGVFRLDITGLSGSTTYHWRAKMMNGGDTVYYPAQAGAGSTVAVLSGNPASTPPGGNSNPFFQAQDDVTSTAQPGMLYYAQLDVGGASESWPLSLIDTGAGFVQFTGDNFRNLAGNYISAAGLQWTEWAGGLWDDGGGDAYWRTDPALTEANPPANMFLPTSKEAPPADLVDIYYSLDGLNGWTLLGQDATPLDGTFAFDLETLTPGDDNDFGDYYWICNANGGDDDVGVPLDGTAAEAGAYEYAAGGGATPVVQAGSIGAAGALLVGDHTVDTLTFSATITEPGDGDDISDAEYRIDGGLWEAGWNTVDTALPQAQPVAVSGLWNAPSAFYYEGVHDIGFRGQDVDGWGAELTDTFTITDTTAPTFNVMSTPPDPASIGGTAFFRFGYADFSPFLQGLGNSYLEYRLNGF